MSYTININTGEDSRHGYQITSTIGERTKEYWAIYPRLSMLEDGGGD